ncbi:hypothetical protein L218DRAFT_358132 [Marasmius fiardii PR-910]|nr:hypothetical protein L218DRAFT_358132 [Marasmius fiardii PR-910]
MSSPLFNRNHVRFWMSKLSVFPKLPSSFSLQSGIFRYWEGFYWLGLPSRSHASNYALRKVILLTITGLLDVTLLQSASNKVHMEESILSTYPSSRHPARAPRSTICPLFGMNVTKEMYKDGLGPERGGATWSF